MKRVFGGLAVAALLLAGCSEMDAISSEAPGAGIPGASTPAGSVGKPAAFTWTGGSTGTVTIHTLEWKRSSGNKSGVGSPPENGGYLVADVTFEGVTGSVSANSLYLVVRDAEGREAANFGAEMGGFTPSLPAGDLGPGRKARGFVAWDLDPKVTHDIEMQTPMADPLVAWKVPAQ